VFVQWAPLNPADKTPRAWGHFSAPSLAGPWERYPLYYTDANHTHPEVSGCSGGATIAPDGTPTLVICGGDTAVPANRSDPMLSHWVQTNVDVTETGSPPAYFPLNIPGKWDCSVYREPSGRYRVTFGSCTMFNGTLRPHQGTGYCDGSKQDGLPQVLSYVSEDFKTWSYLGEQWRGDGGAMSGRRWGPRVECPYQINVRNHTLLKISAVAFGHDFLFVGSTTGNGSAFVPDEGTELKALVPTVSRWTSVICTQLQSCITRLTGSTDTYTLVGSSARTDSMWRPPALTQPSPCLG